MEKALEGNELVRILIKQIEEKDKEIEFLQELIKVMIRGNEEFIIGLR